MEQLNIVPVVGISTNIVAKKGASSDSSLSQVSGWVVWTPSISQFSKLESRARKNLKPAFPWQSSLQVWSHRENGAQQPDLDRRRLAGVGSTQWACKTAWNLWNILESLGAKGCSLRSKKCVQDFSTLCFWELAYQWKPRLLAQRPLSSSPQDWHFLPESRSLGSINMLNGSTCWYPERILKMHRWLRWYRLWSTHCHRAPRRLAAIMATQAHCGWHPSKDG